MALNSSRENIDKLISHFWQNGYLTVSRRFGTYLPDPQPVGTYSVDAVGRYKRKYAFGIILNVDELLDFANTVNKLNFLATRQTRLSNTRVTLFVGVDPENALEAKNLINNLSADSKKNIKLVFLADKNYPKSSAA